MQVRKELLRKKFVTDPFAIYFFILLFKEALEKSEWLSLSSFLKFNKLVAILMSSFGRADVSDLYSALNSIPSDLLEVRKSGNTLITILACLFYSFTCVRSIV